MWGIELLMLGNKAALYHSAMVLWHLVQYPGKTDPRLTLVHMVALEGHRWRYMVVLSKVFPYLSTHGGVGRTSMEIHGGVVKKGFLTLVHMVALDGHRWRYMVVLSKVLSYLRAHGGIGGTSVEIHGGVVKSVALP